MTKGKILVVEDEFMLALLLKDQLQQLGYVDVSIVATGEDAIQQVKKSSLEAHTPDLILMDILLQGKMGGIEAAQQIQSFSNIPIIYVTAHSDDVVVEHAKITQPYGYLVKPIQPEELRVTLDIALYKHEAEEKIRKLNKELQQDIAERRQAEEKLHAALEESHKQQLEISALLETTHAALEHQFFDKNARFIFDSCKNLVGATAGYVALLSEDGTENEVLFLDSGGRSCRVDPSLPMPIRGLREKAYRIGKPVYHNDFSHSEWMKFMPEGHVMLDNVLFLPLIIEGEVVGLIGIANKPRGFTDNDVRIATAFGDIAAITLFNSRTIDSLKKSEEKFHTAFHNAMNGLALVSPEGVFLEANEALKNMLGYGDSLIGMKLGEITHEEDKETNQQAMLEFQQGKREVLQTEKRYITRSGQLVWAHLSVSAVRENQGKLLYFISHIQDITERKKTEEQQATMERQLHQAQKMEAIGTLAGGIAHDFNNILLGMVGYTELIKSQLPQKSHLQEDLDQILIGGTRAKELIQQILAFSRQSDVKVNPVEIVPVVKEILKFMRPSLPSTIKINTNIQIERGVILADPTQIHQIIVNLCSNAGHAMEKTGGELEISLEEVDVDGKFAKLHELNQGTYFKLSVRDTGHGMSPEVKERIFEPFYTTKVVGEGSGMGLSVVHGIVKSYQGMITVSSEEGKGSLFEIFFPRMNDTALSEIEGIKPPSSGGKEHILLVEDEDIPIRLIKKLLEQLGYKVTAFMDSTEALEAFRSTPDIFDLILTDQLMPVMTGFELGNEIIKINPNIPLILMTGYNKLLFEEKAKEVGFHRYLVKPFDQSKLGTIIRELLDGQQVVR